MHAAQKGTLALLGLEEVIEKGTLPSQKVAQGNLANIVEGSKAKAVMAPAVFVVGEVVNLRNLLDQD